MSIPPLEPEALYRRCDPEGLDFETTAEIDATEPFVGQGRALHAVRFGVGMRHKGYNLFALGPAGTGKTALVREEIETRAAGEAVPPDWCYVFNFEDAHKPRALRLPPGKGAELKRDMEQLVKDLHGAIRGVFESDEYRTRTQSVTEALEERQEHTLNEIQEKAKKKGIALLRTPTGLTLAPLREDKPIGPEEFAELPEEERKRIESDIEELQEEMRKAMHQFPLWKKRTDEEIEDLNREMAGAAIEHLLAELRTKYEDLPALVDHLKRVEADVVEHFREFLPDQGQKTPFVISLPQKDEGPPWHHRYQVNLLLAHDRDGGAPVVYADLPAYNNLIGRIEHRAHLGTLETEFTMIRPGALHEANGGYLIVDALKVLMQPFAWEALKRALQAGEIRIESLGQITSLISTVSLEPEPIPLDVKVVMVGERHIYYLLARLDPELEELFKVAVDFEDRIPRDAESDRAYARLIASLVRRSKLRPFDRSGVARVVEQGARLADDGERLTGHLRSIADLVQEADYWAGEAGRETVTAEDVQRAVDAQIGRGDRVRRLIQEAIARGTLLIDAEGAKVGQVNGLAVMSLGGYAFGHPTRITARTRLGKGEVIDIEREVKLGGPIHSKGVLILSGFLAGRYAPDHPLSLSASLVFEQTYGGIEGDSASCAELYALLSSLAQAPIRQSLAVTGSVNQLGEVQAIGGVNEKIEGFFDVCRERGLTGDQGVLIPASNVKHLMLRADVVEAVREGRFAIYAVRHIDEGMEILSGTVAGERDGAGKFPPGSINARVEERLIGFSERLRTLRSKEDKDQPAGNDGGAA